MNTKIGPYLGPTDGLDILGLDVFLDAFVCASFCLLIASSIFL
jgi:hypothetical protein